MTPEFKSWRARSVNLDGSIIAFELYVVVGCTVDAQIQKYHCFIVVSPSCAYIYMCKRRLCCFRTPRVAWEGLAVAPPVVCCTSRKGSRLGVETHGFAGLCLTLSQRESPLPRLGSCRVANNS